MLVHEWMTPNPQTVTSTLPIMDAMRLLRDNIFRRLPVTDDEGNLVGIVTEKDLKEATPTKATSLSIYELNYLLSKLNLADVMVREVASVQSDSPLEEAALIMEENGISGLPVLKGTKLVGIVTITDVLRAFTDMLGLKEGGTRVTVTVEDKPGVLADVAKAAAPSNIVAAVTSSIQEGKQRKLIFRVAGEEAESYPERLKEHGITVEDIH